MKLLKILLLLFLLTASSASAQFNATKSFLFLGLPNTTTARVGISQHLLETEYWPGLPFRQKYDVRLVESAYVSYQDKLEYRGTLGLFGKHVVRSDEYTVFYGVEFLAQHRGVSDVHQTVYAIKFVGENESLNRGVYQQLSFRPDNIEIAYPVFALGTWFFGTFFNMETYAGRGTGRGGILGTTAWDVGINIKSWSLSVGKIAVVRPDIDLVWAIRIGYIRSLGG